MPDTLSTDLRCSLAWLLQEQADLSTLNDSSKLEYARSMADGTGPLEADKIWHRASTLAASSSDDWDLSALTNTVFGGQLTVELARVKAVFVVNTSETDGDVLHLQPGLVQPWTGPFGGITDLVQVPADSCAFLNHRHSGWAVAASAKTLRVHNPGAQDITYQIVLVGTSS